ncbi:DUF6931 family protein [Roseococcus sp. YIM B11640]|uniref:DUF6931 family protein n=1 Tax=Roseococcus sp. YIM B11640 TaxID=3133973 RepID=UPI003C7E6595
MSAQANKLSAALEPLLPRLELDSDCAALLTGLADAGGGVARLAEAGRMPDAMRLLAHALPKREAVWWACMCARAVPALEPVPLDLEALNAAEAWVRKPDEATRRGAMEVAQRGGFRSPEAWAAVAAFWSGGSMAPEGQPVVPPAEHLTGVAVAGAIMLAAARHLPQRADQRFMNFLASARDIASGGAGRLPPEEP